VALSCDVHDLAEASKCYCIPPNLTDGVWIYLLCTWANGGIPPEIGVQLGDPDAGFVFGDPGAGEIFGVP